MPTFTYRTHTIHFRAQGSGPLLLVLHGNTASSRLHDRELAHFGAHTHAVTPDLLGCGQSDRIAAWPADWFEQNADLVHDLIAHLGAENALVMGTSGGAWIALLLAIRHPGSVRAVIADSCVEVQPPDSLRQEVANRQQRTPDQIGFWRHAHGDDWAQVVDADSALLLALADRGGDLFNGQLAAIQCPVLLTASLADSLLSDVAAQNVRMAQQIPDSRLFLHKSGDHPLMWSQPDAFRCAADCFLKEITP